MIEIEKNIEIQVYELISSCLSGDEKIHQAADGFACDFYIEKGVSELNWPPQTCIDIRNKLSYSAYAEIAKTYDRIKSGNYIVIYVDDSLPFWYGERDGKKRNLHFVPFNELKEKARKIKRRKISEGVRKSLYYYIEQNKKEKIKKILKKERISLFLGAGVSKNAGIVEWTKLLEKLREKRNVPNFPNDYNDLMKGRYIVNTYKKVPTEYDCECIFDEETFNNDMKEILYENIQESNLIKAIANIARKANCESIITYNYDDLIEKELGEKCQSITQKTRCIDKNVLPVYHVHGFISKDRESSPIVLGEKEYHKIYQEPYNWGNIEQLHALNRNVCFFIGLSMNDPNLRRLIDVSNEDGGGKSVHYAFLREKDKNREMTEMLMDSMGVNCVWYKEHEDLPEMLNDLMNYDDDEICDFDMDELIL